MKIIPLGTNGFFASFGRQTACYAIPYENILILMDAGSGLFRLAEPVGQKLLTEAEEVYIFLSHYHLDHTFGFYTAFKLLEEKKVRVFAPSGKQVFSEFVRLNYFPIDYSKMHKNFSWNTLKEGVNNLDKFKVSIRKQNHRGEVSLAMRFSFGLSYLTDCESSRKNISLVKGTEILLHEHWFSGETLGDYRKIPLEKQVLDGHATTVGAALFAKKVSVGKLVLIHHNPFTKEKQLGRQLTLAKLIFPNTILAQDLHIITF